MGWLRLRSSLDSRCSDLCHGFGQAPLFIVTQLAAGCAMLCPAFEWFAVAVVEACWQVEGRFPGWS